MDTTAMQNGGITRMSSPEDIRDVITFRVNQKPIRIVAALSKGEQFLAYVQTGQSTERCQGNTVAVKNMRPHSEEGEGHIVFEGSRSEHIFKLPGEYALIYQPNYHIARHRPRMSSITKQQLGVQFI